MQKLRLDLKGLHEYQQNHNDEDSENSIYETLKSTDHGPDSYSDRRSDAESTYFELSDFYIF